MMSISKTIKTDIFLNFFFVFSFVDNFFLFFVHSFALTEIIHAINHINLISILSFISILGFLFSSSGGLNELSGTLHCFYFLKQKMNKRKKKVNEKKELIAPFLVQFTSWYLE